MAITNLAAKGFWLTALLCVFAGAIMMWRGNSAGAVFLALGAFWMIVAIAQGKKKPGP